LPAGAQERRLAAVFAADVVSYGSLMGADEVGTHERYSSDVNNVMAPLFERYHGKIVKKTGDGVLAITTQTQKSLTANRRCWGNSHGRCALIIMNAYSADARAVVAGLECPVGADASSSSGEERVILTARNSTS